MFAAMRFFTSKANQRQSTLFTLIHNFTIKSNFFYGKYKAFKVAIKNGGVIITQIRGFIKQFTPCFGSDRPLSGDI
jgi:hypothetical protein